MRSHRKRFALLLLAFLSLAAPSGFCAPTPFPEPSSAESLFQDRPFGPLPPPTPTPSPKQIQWEDEKPIPAGGRIAGIAAAILAIAALLYGAARAWRSSNLFDRQYRFPPGGEAAVRFGATRCGGHMATIRFRPADRASRSGTEDP